MNSITFFYPSTVTGGAEFLFIRLSICLVNKGIKVYYIDYVNGFARSKLHGTGVKFLDYQDGNATAIDFDTNIVLPPCHIFRVNKELIVNDKSKLLLWFLHPWNVVYLLPNILNHLDNKEPNEIKSFYKKNHIEVFDKLSSILKKIDSFNALLFMDGMSLNFNNEFFDLGIKEKKFLPIGINKSLEKVVDHSLISSNIINIGCLGRVCEDKISSILYLMDKADEYVKNYNKKINLHIIGDGSQTTLIKSKKIDSNLEIIFVGTITETKLDQYLLSRVDILFAMGTSLLEGAKLKLPVAVIPFNNFREIPSSYEMAYLVNTKDLNLGDAVYSKQNLQRSSFDQIIKDVYESNKKKEIGERCYDFFEGNFLIEKSSQNLVSCIDKSSLSYSKYKTFFTNQPEEETNIKINFDLVFLSQPPELDAAEGMMQRVVFVDKVFFDKKRIYITEKSLKKIKFFKFLKALLFMPFFRLFRLKNKCVIKSCYAKDGVHFYHFVFNPKSVIDICGVIYCLIKSKLIYIHSIYNGVLLIKLLWFFKGKVVLDIHGVVPEEVLFLGNDKRSDIYNKIEKKLFKISSKLICVSNKMKNFYLKKYSFINEKTIINIPIFDAESVYKNSFRSVGDKLTLIYAGGGQKWQNIDLMIQSIPSLMDRFRFVFLISPNYLGELKSKIDLLNVELNEIVIDSVDKNRVYDYYSSADLGFILRENTIVNEVSCPTKMIEYISNGLIPVVLQPNIGDFKDLGYSYLLLEDIVGGNLPSQEQMGKNRDNNYAVYQKLNEIKKLGVLELKKMIK